MVIINKYTVQMESLCSFPHSCQQIEDLEKKKKAREAEVLEFKLSRALQWGSLETMEHTAGRLGLGAGSGVAVAQRKQQ